MAKMKNRLGVGNGLVEPSPQAHPPEGIYVARTLVQDCQEVPVRVMNVTHKDQKLGRGSPLAHCEPVTLVALPEMEQPPAPGLTPKLADVTTAAKPHLSPGEFHELEDLVSEYADIFAQDNEDYGRTNRVYHRIDTGEALPIRQPARRVSLAKQAEVNEMLDNMRGQGVIEESDSPWLSPVVLLQLQYFETQRSSSKGTTRPTAVSQPGMQQQFCVSRGVKLQR
ncbi:uncharacterized protein LOC111861267 [Cryptotermes secundus]|uniref:uncharacterized protein LOC111861267 n=1 Tax=Cryptotermes secundus TaxID=105785 RepID=UPI000CD7D609|nr:uncharacterized protein LOC111861267 [Cryptotermes secundus]